MGELQRKASAISRSYKKYESLRQDAKDQLKHLHELEDEYEAAWLHEFNTKMEATGRTWCTHCFLLVYKEKTKEAWDLYAKSDNYSPVFAHTATKYRACPTCAEELHTPKEAKKFAAMFEKDTTDDLPNDTVRAWAIELFDLPSPDPRNP